MIGHRFAIAIAIAVVAPLAVAEPGAASAALPPVHVVSATADTALTDAWRSFGQQPRVGWAAGDGTYSTPLPSGLDAWLFNDTFFGPTTADDGLPTTAKFTHNSAVLATPGGQPLVTVTAGSYGHPQSLVGPTPADPTQLNDHWFWNGDGTVDGAGLQVIEFEQQPTDTPPPFNFQWVATEIATLDPVTMRLRAQTPVPTTGNVQWGVELFHDNGFTYIYGVEGDGLTKYLHLARVPQGRLTSVSAWRYWTGTGWSADPGSSTRVLGDVGSSYGVTREGDSYLLTTFGSGLESTIHAYTAPSPTGPFTHEQTVYTAPEAAQGMYTYNVAAHPEISRPGELVISYNTNDVNLSGLYADIDRNRPRFVTLRLSR
ncbi:MAG TPA: DUF4185 domain-containing protein [Pseudonocardiaceae bacterium]|jgi:hypothetical protein|nr:DUF4185 domain-containing protein [Pseudonocardiaceae bacterium]